MVDTIAGALGLGGHSQAGSCFTVHSVIHADDNGATAPRPPVAAQLWVLVDDGKWRVRADHVIAVGVARASHYREDGRRFEVQARTPDPDGTDGDVGPTDYVLARFSTEEEARTAASAVTHHMGTWTGGYGTLQVSHTGKVMTSRPKPATEPTEAPD